MSQVQLDTERKGEDLEEQPLLQISNLKVHFTKHHGTFLKRRPFTVRAVDDVSFALKKSETMSIVGESGSGKTTVALCVLGLIRPTSGSIKYNGVEVTKLSGEELKKYRRDVQIVYQDPFESLNPRHNVLSTLSVPLVYLNGEKNKDQLVEKSSRLLEEVGLDPNEVLRRYPHQLSGGQRQRVNIARALASDPKLLVADEPITMLDAAQKMNILSLLSDLKLKRKLTVLLITHDLASARRASQRTIVMYLGRIVESGRTSVLLSRPYHPYVELILSATPKLAVTASSTSAYSTAWLEESMSVTQGCVFRPRCKYATEICAAKEPELEAKSEKDPTHRASCHNPLNTVKKTTDAK